MWNIEKIVSKGDYDYAVVKGHPNATKNSYVLHHRIVMENHLNRLLNSNEVVHHKNGNKKDNRIENLELLTSSEHSTLHGLDKGRLWVELKCPSCNTIFHKEKRLCHIAKRGFFSSCSNTCRGQFSRKIQLQGRTHEVEKAISENIVREYKVYSHDNPEETSLTEDP